MPVPSRSPEPLKNKMGRKHPGGTLSAGRRRATVKTVASTFVPLGVSQWPRPSGSTPPCPPGAGSGFSLQPDETAGRVPHSDDEANGDGPRPAPRAAESLLPRAPWRPGPPAQPAPRATARVSPFPRASHLLGSSEVCNLWRLPLPYSYGPPFERQQLAVAVGTEGDLTAAQAAPPPRWEVAFLGTFREPATPGFHAAQKSDFILLQK